MRLYNNQGQLCSFYSGKTKSAGLCLTKGRLEAQSEYFILPLPQRKQKEVSLCINDYPPILKMEKGLQ